MSFLIGLLLVLGVLRVLVYFAEARADLRQADAAIKQAEAEAASADLPSFPNPEWGHVREPLWVDPGQSRFGGNTRLGPSREPEPSPIAELRTGPRALPLSLSDAFAENDRRILSPAGISEFAGDSNPSGDWRMSSRSPASAETPAAAMGCGPMPERSSEPEASSNTTCSPSISDSTTSDPPSSASSDSSSSGGGSE